MAYPNIQSTMTLLTIQRKPRSVLSDKIDDGFFLLSELLGGLLGYIAGVLQ